MHSDSVTTDNQAEIDLISALTELDDSPVDMEFAGGLLVSNSVENSAVEAMENGELQPASIQIMKHGFSAGRYNFLIDSDVRCEIIPGCKYYEVPNTPDFFLGLCNIRGNLVPLYFLDKLIGLGGKGKKWNYVFILGLDVDAVAIALENIPVTVDVGETFKLHNLPDLVPVVETAALAGYVVNDDLWIEVDYKTLFESALKE